MASILNLKTGTPMEPDELFGRSTKRIMAACKKVMDCELRPYADCYRAPNHPSIKEIYQNRNMHETIASQYKTMMEKWCAENPEEFAKEEASRHKWELERERQFRTIYGIAKRKGLYLKWHGKDSCVVCPDQWEVYRNGEAIARICLL